MAQALKRAWILPFGLPPLIKGDHRLLGLDFDPDTLFGNSPATPAPALIRGVNSKHELHVKKFCIDTVNECNKHQISERIATLMQKPHLSNADLQELERIDSRLTRILVAADRRCQPLSVTPWSPTVQKAYLRHRYWSLRLTAFLTQKDLRDAINAIAQRLEPTDIEEIPGLSLSSHLRQAQ